MNQIRKLLRLKSEESGSTLVEFAMTGLTSMIVLFCLLEWLWILYAYHFVSYAADQGARFASVRGTSWSTDETVSCSTTAPPSFTMVYNCQASASDVQNYVRSLAVGQGLYYGNVYIDYPNTTPSATDIWPGTKPSSTDSSTCSANAGTPLQGCYVYVRVTYTFTAIPFLQSSQLNLHATAQEVMQN
jgi:Flp pilus assembly protein TadG